MPSNSWNDQSRRGSVRQATLLQTPQKSVGETVLSPADFSACRHAEKSAEEYIVT